MTDRELLELAAKAAGIAIVRSRLDDPMHCDMLIESSPRNLHQKAGPWNPLTDDGDALRLAVKLGIDLKASSISFQHGRTTFRAEARFDWLGNRWFAEEHGEYSKHNADPCAATRRAIVRAAAEIGKATP